MRELAPLVRLDLATLVSPRTLAGLAVFAAVLVGINGVDSVASTLGPALGAVAIMLAIATVSGDDVYRLSLLYGALPVRRRSVIGAHYVTALGTYLIAGLLGVLAAVTLSTPDARGSAAASSLAAIAVTSLTAAVMMPLIVRFGTRGASLAWLSVLGVAFLGGSLLRQFDPSFTRLAAWLSALAEHPLAAFLASATLVAGGWLASYLVSVHVYERKDF